MFGFLKDKLKKAIGAFSSSAKDDVKEEQVVVEREVKRPAPKKETTKKATPQTVEKKPEAKKEAAKPVEKKKETPTPVERKPEAKPVVAPAPTKKELPKRTEEPAPARIVTKPIPAKKEITKPAVKEPAVEKEAPKPAEPEKKGFFGRIFGKKEEPKEATPEEESLFAAEAAPVPVEEPAPVVEQAIIEEVPEEPMTEEVTAPEPVAQEKEESTGFFGKIREAVTKRTLSPEKFDEIFWELELAMLENNVAVEVIEKIKNDLKDELTSGKVSRLDLEGQISARLKQSIEELFDVPTFDLIARIKKAPKPFKLCIIGVNGSGKTTTLAKIVKKLQDNKLSVVVAASDTFRAAAIQQLQEHCDNLSVKLISQGYGADPAAVAFDAIKHAEAQQLDVVLIDTAGRLHSNTNLMAELEKVVRVAKPDLKIFVGEAITGNDCVEQAKTFDELVGIDAIVLSKADVDEKGGAAISVSYVTGKPILFLGTGQTYDDLEAFDKEKVVGALGL